MKYVHQPKDPHARSAPLPAMSPPLFTQNVGADGGVSGMRRSGGVNEARRRLALRGYRLHSGAVFYIVNDDLDQGLEEVLIANWDGRVEDAENALELHGWPTSPWIMCPCGEGEAELGGFCSFCARESVEWQKVGEV